MNARSVCICASCFVFVTFIATNGFNLNLRHALVFSDPENQTGSYYGFTVVLRKQKLKYWLVVGAPRGNSTYRGQRDIYQPGVVYQCSVDKKGDCQNLVFDRSDIRPVPAYRNSPIEEKRDNSWLGGAIAVEDNGARLLVCAPRWRNSHYLRTHEVYLMNGACYLTGDTAGSQPTWDLILPLNNIEKQTRNNHYFYVYGEAGFTAHLPKNSTEVVLGAPGVFSWQGAIIRIKDQTLHDGQSGTTIDTVAEIPSPLNTESVPAGSYLGYSLSSGRFLSTSLTHLYVAASPRNADFKGKENSHYHEELVTDDVAVVIYATVLPKHICGLVFQRANKYTKVYVFDFPRRNGYDLQYIKDLEGTQMGEYFGGALCAVDLNGDHLDDMVVGAPQFSFQAANSAQLVGDEGRIYVYINGDHGRFAEITGDRMVLGSRRHGARFGTALANIGDLNMDGYEDIAVGAPYEGNGAVYIYHGSVDGIKYEPAQIIRAENIDPQIKGFGISLSKGADVDGNHYNDIAVGAFKSGHAVVLKSHPIITFKPTLNTSTRSVSRKGFNFSSTACLSYTGWSVPDTVDAKVTLQVDLSFGRANFISNEFRRTNAHAYNVTLQRGKQWCKDLKVQNAQQIVYRTEPLLLAMIYELTNNPNKIQPRRPGDSATDEFCMECPVLDSAQPTGITTMVAFETGCKSLVCTPDIKIDAGFMGIEETFILGEKQTLDVRVEVENIGEPAFFTRVNLIIPKVTPVVEIPSICYDLSNQDIKETYVLVCDIGYPLEKNYTMDLVMSMKDVPAGTKTLTFKANVTSAGNDINPSDNHKELVLTIVIQADMTIAGIPSQDQIVYMAKGNTYIKGLMLNHTFQVWNLGPSTVETAEIEFQIPHQYVLPPVQEIFMRVLEPQLQTSAKVMCTPVMGFSYWNPSSEIPTIDPKLSDGEGPDDDFYQLSNRRPPSLSKRSVSNTETREENFADSMPKVSAPDDAPSTSNFSMPPSKRTLFLNCTDPKVDCFTVKCSGGPFLPNKTRAVINFQLRPDFVVLESQLQMKDIIFFSSMGTVTIRDPSDAVQPQGHKPDYVDVHTRFLGTMPEGSVDTWIIVLAVICGILVLLLITTALHKIGFFKREKKEELKALKDAEVVTHEEEECSDFQADVISSDEL